MELLGKVQKTFGIKEVESFYSVLHLEKIKFARGLKFKYALGQWHFVKAYKGFHSITCSIV